MSTYYWVVESDHSLPTSSDFDTPAAAMVWGAAHGTAGQVLVTPTDYGPHGINHGVILDVVDPPYDPIVAALNDYVGFATWAVGDGYGSGDGTELRETQAFLLVLEEALGVKATREL